MNQIFMMLLSLFILGGCVKNESLNIYEYKTKVNTKIKIPDVCKAEYNYTLPKVAVLDLINNTTYGKADIKNNSSSASVGLGIGINGFVAGAKGKDLNTNRTINTKLSQSITSLIETIILNTGGSTLYTRSELERLNDELKLQDSGLLDPSSVVEFGKLSGVQYIVTGTIDNVTTNRRGYKKYTNSLENAVKDTQNQELKLASSVLSLGASLLDGTDMQTNITIKIIDVSDGKILFSKGLQSDIKISSDQEPTYDQIISGIKQSITKVMPTLKSEFSKYFKVQGYVTKVRQNNDNIIAQINLGNDDKIKRGDKFELFELEENVDPLTNIKSCDKVKLPTILNVTNQISQSHSWTKVENGKPYSLKILQLVQKKSK
jgi:hypothetical protein